MGFELPMLVVMEAFDGGVLDGAVHPLHLAVGPRVLHLGEAMLDPVLPAPHVEHVRHVPSCRTIGVARGKGELDAIDGKHGVDLVGHGVDQGREEG